MIRAPHPEARPKLTSQQSTTPAGALASDLETLDGEVATAQTLAGDASDPSPSDAGIEVPDQLGDFVIERRIGAGGMGEVFAARHVETGERVALKRLTGASATSLYRFKREFRALVDIVHPNLVRLGELVIMAEGAAFFTMELVDGQPFDAYVRGRTPVGEVPNLVRFQRTIRQLAAGVHHLHEARLAHRDLKPTNVLVTREGRVVILDFGLIASCAEPDAGITLAGQILGTPAYMAPEQIRAGEHGPAVDLYALGVMLFQCVTGRLPFVGTPLTILLDKQGGEAPNPHTIVPAVPAELGDWIVQLLDLDPAARPSCALLLERFAGLQLGAVGSGAMPAATWTGAMDRKSAEIFVGRGPELAILESSLAIIQAEQRAVTVFVRGASGLGKTALVSHFLGRASEHERALVLRGRCFERESVPFKGVDAVVDALSAHLRRLPEAEAMQLAPRRVGALVKIFPVLEDIWPIPAREAVQDDAQGRWQVGVASLREVLARIADGRPLIVHVEDFQWADVDGAKLLTELMRGAESPVMLLVVGFRDEVDQREALRELTSAGALRDRQVRDIRLEPLTDEEASALASALVGAREHADVSAPDLASPIAQAKGSPFFLRQLLASEHDSSASISEADGSLDRIVVRRIAQLAAATRRMLALIAVAGGPVARAAVLGIQADPEALSELQAMALITIDERPTSVEIEAAHDRIREVMVAELDTAELRELHLALAHALVDHGGAPELLAEHFERGGDPIRALHYVELAAAQAAAALGFGRAGELYRRALTLLPADAEPERRAALQAALAEQVGNVGRCGEAAGMFLELIEQSSDSNQLVAYRHQAITHLIASGQIDRGLDVLEAALASFGERLPRRKWAVILACIGGRIRLAWRGDKVDLSGTKPIDARTRDYLTTLLAGTGGLMSQEALLTTMLQGRLLLAALEAGEAFHLTFALMWEMILSYNLGFPGRARRIVDQVHAIALASHDPIVAGLDVVNDSTLSYMSRQWVEADDKWDRLLAKYEDLPRMGRICRRLRGFRSQTKVILGSFNVLRECLPEWSSDAIRAGRRQETVEMLAFSGLVEVFTGDLERARGVVDEGRSIWDVPRYTATEFFLDNAEIPLLIASGEWQRAATQIEASLANARRWQIHRVISIHEEMLDLHGRTFAALAIHTNDAKAASRARASADRLRRSKHAMSKARAAVIDAALHTLAGEHERALVCWGAAGVDFERCGMRAHQAAVQLRLAAVSPDDEATTLRASAARYGEAEGICDLERLATVLAPARAGVRV